MNLIIKNFESLTSKKETLNFVEADEDFFFESLTKRPNRMLVESLIIKPKFSIKTNAIRYITNLLYSYKDSNKNIIRIRMLIIIILRNII